MLNPPNSHINPVKQVIHCFARGEPRGSLLPQVCFVSWLMEQSCVSDTRLGMRPPDFIVLGMILRQELGEVVGTLTSIPSRPAVAPPSLPAPDMQH